MTLHRGQDIALSQLVTHRWLVWYSCPSAGDSPVQGMALREPVSPTAPPSPGSSLATPRLATFGSLNSPCFYFPSGGQCLPGLFVSTILALAFKSHFFIFFSLWLFFQSRLWGWKEMLNLKTCCFRKTLSFP